MYVHTRRAHTTKRTDEGISSFDGVPSGVWGKRKKKEIIIIIITKKKRYSLLPENGEYATNNTRHYVRCLVSSGGNGHAAVVAVVGSARRPWYALRALVVGRSFDKLVEPKKLVVGGEKARHGVTPGSPYYYYKTLCTRATKKHAGNKILLLALPPPDPLHCGLWLSGFPLQDGSHVPGGGGGGPTVFF